jgi:hypothetical protein
MSEPTTRRISTAPSDSEMPWTMPFSSSFQVKPFAMPMMMPTAAARISAIWLGPPEEPSPKR